MDTSPDGAPSSPPKGKENHKTWRASWWDFYPILEKPGRPVVWSHSSVILTAHPTQPLITGRHFSSSKQFVLPSPTPVISAPASYEPPTVISVSPIDAWLFAYYPRRDSEGLGCLWKRGAQIDSWQVKEFWNFPKAGGAVTASWLAAPREWAATSSGIPTRLPFRGPQTPISHPTLAIVTEDNNFYIYYYRYILTAFRSIRHSLMFSGTTVESQQSPHSSEGLENVNGTKYCTDAVIGMGYNESSILIATRSRRMPSPPVHNTSTPPFNSMDLSVSMNLGIMPQDQRQLDCDTWGDEYTVEVHEANFRFDGVHLNLFVHTSGHLNIGNAAIAKMTFFCTPAAPSQTRQGEQANKARNQAGKGHIYLGLTSIDFHSYTSPPTSTLTLYSVTQKSSPSNRGQVMVWAVNRETSRTIENGILVHVESFVDFASPVNGLVHAYILEHSGRLDPVKTRAKEVPIGNLRVLNLPDLTDNTNFEPTAVNYPLDSVGRDVPVFATISPNQTLLCTLSTSLWKSQITVHTIPRRNILDSLVPHPIALGISNAILGRTSSEDAIHCIASRNISLTEATDVLYQTLHILEDYKDNLPYAYTWDIMGVATEVYRSRTRDLKDEKEAQLLKDRWHTAHDVCSIAACNIAFEDCREDDGYDLEAVWQLIGLCTWVVNFTENLMKTAVLCSNAGNTKESALALLSSPMLLHLAHPFALQNLIVIVKHLKGIRTHLGSLPAGGEMAHLAQLTLVDTIDCCGIDFGSLIVILEESLSSVKSIDSRDCQRALSSCQPLPAMQPLLAQLVKKISESENLLNKTALFVKPFDLVDGVARLSMDSRNKDENDVITKGSLVKLALKDECLRCGGKTGGSKNVAKTIGLSAPRWVMWERMWRHRCVCGGPWMSVPVH